MQLYIRPHLEWRLRQEENMSEVVNTLLDQHYNRKSAGLDLPDAEIVAEVQAARDPGPKPVSKRKMPPGLKPSENKPAGDEPVAPVPTKTLADLKGVDNVTFD